MVSPAFLLTLSSARPRNRPCVGTASGGRHCSQGWLGNSQGTRTTNLQRLDKQTSSTCHGKKQNLKEPKKAQKHTETIRNSTLKTPKKVTSSHERFLNRKHQKTILLLCFPPRGIPPELLRGPNSQMTFTCSSLRFKSSIEAFTAAKAKPRFGGFELRRKITSGVFLVFSVLFLGFSVVFLGFSMVFLGFPMVFLGVFDGYRLLWQTLHLTST